MPIEFSCINCNKLLRVPDGSREKPCQCPSCGAISTVPALPKIVLPTQSPAQNLAQNQAQSPRAANSEDGKISVTCPNCQYSLRCKPELKGTKGQCKQCKHIFVIGEIRPAVIEKSALVFSCPKCSQLFDGKAEMAGRKGRCHACGEVFSIQLRETTTNSLPENSTSAASAVEPRAELPTVPKVNPATSQPRSTSRESTIQLVCGSCSGGLEVPASAAGQTTACPHCHQLLQVPKNGEEQRKSAKSSVFDQPSDDIFGGLNVNGTQPASVTSSSDGLFDSLNVAGGLPYVYPDHASYQPAYQPTGYQQPNYPTSNYPSNNYQSPSYQSPYQPSSISPSMSNTPTSGSRERLKSIATWYRQLIWSILANIAMLVIVGLAVALMIVVIGQNPQAPPSNGVALSIVVGYFLTIFFSMAIGIWVMVSYIMLCLKLYEGSKALWFILGYFFGGCVIILPLILIVMALMDANSELKQREA